MDTRVLHVHSLKQTHANHPSTVHVRPYVHLSPYTHVRDTKTHVTHKTHGTYTNRHPPRNTNTLRTHTGQSMNPLPYPLLCYATDKGSSKVTVIPLCNLRSSTSPFRSGRFSIQYTGPVLPRDLDPVYPTRLLE